MKRSLSMLCAFFPVFLLVFAFMWPFSTAHANLIQYGGFNGAPVPSGKVIENVSSGNSTTIVDWTVIGTGSTVGWVLNNYFTPAAAGQESILFNGATSTGVDQSFATTKGTEYVVTFYVSGYPGSTITDKGQVTAGSSPAGTFTYTPITTGSNKNSATNMNWQLESYTFTAGAGSTTLLSFNTMQAGGPASGLVLGNVNVTPAAVAPLPPALLLFAPGLLGLVGIRKKLKK